MYQLFEKARQLNKKGQAGLGNIPNVGITFTLIAIIFVVATVIISSLGNSAAVSGNTDAQEIVNSSTDAVGEIPNNWLVLIAVILAAVIIVILVRNGFGAAAR